MAAKKQLGSGSDYSHVKKREGMFCIGELLDQLPEPYKKMVWANVENEREVDPAGTIEMLETVLVVNNPHEAMLNAFDWKLCNEKNGAKYWSKIYKRMHTEHKNKYGNIQK